MGHSSRRQNPVTAYLTVLSNVLCIGVSAATAGTLRLVHQTAAAASELTIEPLNSLVQSTTKAYFAPQISYPERPWSGMVESLSSRRRAWTMSDTSSKRTLEGRRDSLQQREQEGRAKFRRGSVASQNGRVNMPQRLDGASSSQPPRSTSFPTHLTSEDFASIASQRRRRPTLHPIDIAAARAVASKPSQRTLSPLSCSVPASAGYEARTPLLTPSPLGTPYLSTSASPSSSSFFDSLPPTPTALRLGTSAPPASTLASQHEAGGAKTSNGSKAGGLLASKGKLGHLEIARSSFWNLVGLAGQPSEEIKGGPVRGHSRQHGFTVGQHDIVISCEEDDDDEEEEEETYKRVCYV